MKNCEICDISSDYARMNMGHRDGFFIKIGYGNQSGFK